MNHLQDQPSLVDFDRAYRKVVLENRFFEKPEYYHQQKKRYRCTLRYLPKKQLHAKTRVLEIGGGQIALLCHELYHCEAVVGDVTTDYAQSVTKHGIALIRCDLLHDDLPYRDYFDLVVLCEVIEHLPVPGHIPLEKIGKWLKPGGCVFLTTPNLYRFRNLARMSVGAKIFCPFFYPAKGKSLGHPIEYSASHLKWQLERAGFEPMFIKLVQLCNKGATPLTTAVRWLTIPLQTRPLWRDNLVACARKPLDPCRQ